MVPDNVILGKSVMDIYTYHRTFSNEPLKNMENIGIRIKILRSKVKKKHNNGAYRKS